jgi:hypothetical protein
MKFIPTARLLGFLFVLPFTAGCTGSIGDGSIDLNANDGPGSGNVSETGSDGDGGAGGSSDATGGAGLGSTTGSGVPMSGNSGGSGGSGNPGQSGTDSMFQAQNPWTKPVAAMTPSPSSKAITGWLDSHGGWGYGELRIDFSIEVLSADAAAPMVDFVPTDEFYSPDCDNVPMPMPAGGAIEAESGYACESDGDCHLVVVHKPTNTLYEMWRANLVGGTFYGGCAAKWDLTKAYGENLRGEGCTSADGGGFPIAPMLFSADEVAKGEITHAIRFILPNARIREMVYVHPGTHSTFSTSGGPDAPPYGVRMRLRADFPLDSLPTEGARVVARGLQKFGMFLADGGNIALTGRSDRFTEHKWADVGVDAKSLNAIQVTDMEVVDMGEPITWDGECKRNP